MSTALDTVLGRLERVKKNGPGYMAACPAHEDREPSLSVSEGEDGRVLLKCWGGCNTAAVIRALGLRWTDLFPPRDYRRPPRNR